MAIYLQGCDITLLKKSDLCIQMQGGHIENLKN